MVGAASCCSGRDVHGVLRSAVGQAVPAAGVRTLLLLGVDRGIAFPRRIVLVPGPIVLDFC
mgnify:CR=1 FL=1